MGSMIIRVFYDLDADQLHFITRHNLDRIGKTIRTPQTILVHWSAYLATVGALDGHRHLFNIKFCPFAHSPSSC